MESEREDNKILTLYGQSCVILTCGKGFYSPFMERMIIIIALSNIKFISA